MKARRRGIILFVSLIIASLMMVWAVAATHRANFQSSAMLFSYRKSEAHYLAKAALSRALNQLNTDTGWRAAHTGETQADTSTPGTACWVDANGTQLILRCQATVGTQVARLGVPLLQLSASDTHIYSIAPSLNGGPDLIAWTTVQSDQWSALPPIPGCTRILSAASTANTDVYAIAQGSGGTNLWRYRAGQGWFQMPDTPAGVSISSLSAGGDTRLVCRGSDNSLMVLPLEASLQWAQAPAPSAISLEGVAAHPAGQPLAYATATDGSGQAVLYQYDLSLRSWSQLPTPPATDYDPSSGAVLASGGVVPNFSGGVVADDSGKLYVASNPPGRASVVYKYEPSTPGGTTGSWQALPPIPAFQFQGTTLGTPAEFATASAICRPTTRGTCGCNPTIPARRPTPSSSWKLLRRPGPERDVRAAGNGKTGSELKNRWRSEQKAGEGLLLADEGPGGPKPWPYWPSSFPWPASSLSRPARRRPC